MIKSIFIPAIVLYLAIPKIETSAVSVPQISQLQKQLLDQGRVLVEEVATPHKSGQTFKAITLVDASVNDVYKILTQFKNHKGFMPNVGSSDVIEKNKKSALINYTLNLPLNQTKRYRIQTEFKKHKDEALIQWKKSEWPELTEKETIADTEGYWLIKNDPQFQNKTLLIYQLYADPGHVPSGFKWIVDRVSKQCIPDTVAATRDYIHKKFNR